MAAVSLHEAKVHCRVDFSDDDALITSLIEAAEAYVEQIGVAIATPIDPPVRLAVLLLVGHWYDTREAAGAEPPRAIAFGVNALTAAYREYNL